MDNASTHEKADWIQIVWHKQYDFSIFGCDVTNAVVVVFLLIKNDWKIYKLHEKCHVKLSEGIYFGCQLMNWFPTLFLS